MNTVLYHLIQITDTSYDLLQSFEDDSEIEEVYEEMCHSPETYTTSNGEKIRAEIKASGGRIVIIPHSFISDEVAGIEESLLIDYPQPSMLIKELNRRYTV